MLLLHVATEAEWTAARATGSYERSTYGHSLAEVGFVHACGSRAQVDAVLEAFYADVREPLCLLVIDPARLDSPWRLDEVPGHPDPYPHVYGPVRVDAVIETTQLTRRDGRWMWEPTR